MKFNVVSPLMFLFTVSSAHAGFLDNDNNRQIEACRAGLQRFLQNVPFANGTLNGQNGGTSCYLRYYNIVENQSGHPV